MWTESKKWKEARARGLGEMKVPPIKKVECPTCGTCFEPFQVEKASRGSKVFSRGAIWAIRSGLLRMDSAIDYGCGLMRNAELLKSHFFKVTFCDTKIQCERLSAMFPDAKFELASDLIARGEVASVVFLLSVIHIIPTREKRMQVLEDVKRLTGQSGKLVAEVPTWETFYRGKEKNHGDGIASSGLLPTFYRPMTATELKSDLQDAGFIIESSHVTKPTACYIAISHD